MIIDKLKVYQSCKLLRNNLLIILILFIIGGCQERVSPETEIEIVFPEEVYGGEIEVTPVEGIKGELAVEIYSTLSIISLESGSLKSLYFNLPSFSSFQWSPDGQNIVFMKLSDVWTVNINNKVRNLTNTPRRLELAPRFSPNGNLIAFIRTEEELKYDNQEDGFMGPSFGSLILINSNGTNYRVLDSRSVQDFCWSPDSRQIVYSVDGNLYIFNLDTNKFQHLPLTDYGLPSNLLACSPSWSPKGNAIAFSFSSKHKPEEKSVENGYAVLNLDDNKVKIIKSFTITATMAYEGHPIGEHIGGCFQRPALWSPSGEWLLLVTDPIPRTDFNGLFMVINSDGTQEKSIGDIYGAYTADWSPDGKWIAYTNMGDGSLRIVNPMNPEEDYRITEELCCDNGLAWRPIKNKQ